MSESLPMLQPFAALRPAPGRAAEVLAPPYDVLSSAEARQRAQGKPWSFLHVSKAEIDLPEDVDVHAPEVYAKAGENIRAMVEAGVLVRDDAPGYYAYRLVMGDHVQTGVVAAGSIADYDANRIRRHEFTRPDKEDDRVAQIEAVNAQTGPVFLTHRHDAAVAAVLARATAGAPDTDEVADDGVRHILWRIAGADDIRALTVAFQAMPATYIADGHHRSAAASRVAKARPGSAAAQTFLVVSFPDDEVNILDYNRVVRDLNGLNATGFLEAVSQAFTITPSDGPAKPTEAHTFGMYLAGKWYRLALRDPAPADPVQRLDVSLLADRLVGPILKITDPRRDPRIDFVGGIRGMAELERRVDSGDWAAAFALFPTSLDDLMAVADAGQVMPPKSTWFEPKLADGMVSLVLD